MRPFPKYGGVYQLESRLQNNILLNAYNLAEEHKVSAAIADLVAKSKHSVIQAIQHCIISRKVNLPSSHCCYNRIKAFELSSGRQGTQN